MNGDGHWQQPRGHWQSPPGPPRTGAGAQEPTWQWQQGPDMRWQQSGPYAGMHHQQDPNWQYHQNGGQRQGMSTPLIVSLIVLVAVALAAIGAVVYLVAFAPSDGSPRAAEEVPPAVETVWETETAAPGAGSAGASPAPTPRPQAPAGASMCSDNGNDRHGRAATGSGVTSCEFANAVRDAYVGSSVSGSGSISAYSPVTGQSYTMNCAGDAVVTCRGGNNAVVHIY